jgi:hypothetical protein
LVLQRLKTNGCNRFRLLCRCPPSLCRVALMVALLLHLRELRAELLNVPFMSRPQGLCFRQTRSRFLNLLLHVFRSCRQASKVGLVPTVVPVTSAVERDR